MGQAKIKQYNRKRFLAAHLYCSYCGGKATTTDHCPPRSFFANRVWPEGYEFPACESCNQEARKDEQILGLLAKISLTEDVPEPLQNEWRKQFSGILNNQREIVLEWLDVSEAKRKRIFRDQFGELGDRLRYDGWNLFNLGTSTREAITRFMVKLAKALYYKHLNQLFDGAVYVNHIDAIRKDATPEILARTLALAPELAKPERSGRSLAEQFIYRFNISPELGVIYAVVQFSEQMVFQILAIRCDTHERLLKMRAEAGKPTQTPRMIEGRLTAAHSEPSQGNLSPPSYVS